VSAADEATLDAIRALIRQELARVGLRPPVPGLGAWRGSPERDEWEPVSPPAAETPTT